MTNVSLMPTPSKWVWNWTNLQRMRLESCNLTSSGAKPYATANTQTDAAGTRATISVFGNSPRPSAAGAPTYLHGENVDLTVARQTPAGESSAPRRTPAGESAAPPRPFLSVIFSPAQFVGRVRLVGVTLEWSATSSLFGANATASGQERVASYPNRTSIGVVTFADCALIGPQVAPTAPARSFGVAVRNAALLVSSSADAKCCDNEINITVRDNVADLGSVIVGFNPGMCSGDGPWGRAICGAGVDEACLTKFGAIQAVHIYGQNKTWDAENSQLWVETQGKLTLTDLTLWDRNSSSAVLVQRGGTLIISRCRFGPGLDHGLTVISNRQSNASAAIAAAIDANAHRSQFASPCMPSLEVRGSSFHASLVQLDGGLPLAGVYGGAIVARGLKSVTIIASSFTRNRVTTHQRGTASIIVAGAVAALDVASFQMDLSGSNSFGDNTVRTGGDQVDGTPSLVAVCATAASTGANCCKITNDTAQQHSRPFDLRKFDLPITPSIAKTCGR
jgi:hypothetical protein